MEELGRTVIADAIVEFADGRLARFTSVEVLPRGILRATFADKVYVADGAADGKGHKPATITDTAYYSPSAWRSVQPPKRGVLMVGTWGTRPDGRQYHSNHCVKENVTAEEAREHAALWLSGYLPQDAVDKMRHLFSDHIELGDGMGTARFYMHWPQGPNEDIDVALETRAQLNPTNWRRSVSPLSPSALD